MNTELPNHMKDPLKYGKPFVIDLKENDYKGKHDRKIGKKNYKILKKNKSTLQLTAESASRDRSGRQHSNEGRESHREMKKMRSTVGGGFHRNEGTPDKNPILVSETQLFTKGRSPE